MILWQLRTTKDLLLMSQVILLTLMNLNGQLSIKKGKVHRIRLIRPIFKNIVLFTDNKTKFHLSVTLYQFLPLFQNKMRPLYPTLSLLMIPFSKCQRVFLGYQRQNNKHQQSSPNIHSCHLSTMTTSITSPLHLS